ncbi:MAG: hypothetical protein ACO1SX_21790 [Actinomycetota bacterium]
MRLRHPLTFLFSVAAVLWSLGGGHSAAQEAAPADPHYAKVVKAYRGELTHDEIDELAEDDPAPGLYLSEKTPAERAAARFFGSLPDEAHETLRKTGVLKWQVDHLPSEQRGWVRDAAKRLEARREGPFPMQGKSLATTGFARIEMEGEPLPQYCWWISAEGARRPAWVTLVRAIGLLTREYSNAYLAQLPDLITVPESPPIAAKRWVKVRTTPPRPAPAVATAPIPGAEFFWDVVKAYRRKLGKDPLKKLTEGDPLLTGRLKSAEAPTRALNELFAKLTDEELEALLSRGVLSWSIGDLTKPRIKLLDTILRDLNTRSGAEPYLLSPAIAARTGFAVVRVPEVEDPVISWWVSSPNAAYPAWIPLVNQQGVMATGYHRSHLGQIPGGS